jgi:hypothetical protein
MLRRRLPESELSQQVQSFFRFDVALVIATTVIPEAASFCDSVAAI